MYTFVPLKWIFHRTCFDKKENKIKIKSSKKPATSRISYKNQYLLNNSKISHKKNNNNIKM